MEAENGKAPVSAASKASILSPRGRGIAFWDNPQIN